MGVNYTSVIDRMRWAGRLKNDSAVARDLGVTPQALSNYKKRGEMPADLVLKFASLHNVSIDWLVNGSPLPPPDDTPKYHPALKHLSPEEMICVGKVLKVLRSGQGAAEVLKHSLDAFEGMALNKKAVA